MQLSNLYLQILLYFNGVFSVTLCLRLRPCHPSTFALITIRCLNKVLFFLCYIGLFAYKRKQQRPRPKAILLPHFLSLGFHWVVLSLCSLTTPSLHHIHCCYSVPILHSSFQAPTLPSKCVSRFNQSPFPSYIGDEFPYPTGIWEWVTLAPFPESPGIESQLECVLFLDTFFSRLLLLGPTSSATRPSALARLFEFISPSTHRNFPLSLFSPSSSPFDSSSVIRSPRPHSPTPPSPPSTKATRRCPVMSGLYKHADLCSVVACFWHI